MPPSHKKIYITLSLVHLIYKAGDNCMCQNVCLSKNQIARETQRVWPYRLSLHSPPTLDKSLKEDKSLHLVRALHYYQDRTKDLRDNKQLVFVSFKRNISPATISSWIKQSVLCYKQPDQEALQLHQVKSTMLGPLQLPRPSREVSP